MHQPKPIKMIHTSDWHLGRSLYGRKRTEETGQFLGWLADEILARDIDVLLVAGDIFDNTTPNHLAQKQYYRFLSRVAQSCCRHVVVTAGNHDSPSLLNAPKDMLEALDIHVVGHITDDLEDEVLVLTDESGSPELVVCAVPYLRDRDIRKALPGESLQDKAHNLVEGIRNHYRDVCAMAEKMRADLDKSIPIVAMGHLFAQGGITQDGVRELYVGSLAHVDMNALPEIVDYYALGHLHKAQRVDKKNDVRYSGSPIPIGFGEATQEKFVLEVTLTDETAHVEKVPVPRFQELIQIQGDLEATKAEIQRLREGKSQAWLEIIFEGNEIVGDLPGELAGMIADSNLEILRIKNTQLTQRILGQTQHGESLDDLTIDQVFERYLETNVESNSQRDELMKTFREIVTQIEEEDSRAGSV